MNTFFDNNGMLNIDELIVEQPSFIKIMEDGNADRVERAPYFHYEKPYIFLRDVDVEPIILENEEIFDDPKAKFEL